MHRPVHPPTPDPARRLPGRGAAGGVVGSRASGVADAAASLPESAAFLPAQNARLGGFRAAAWPPVLSWPASPA